MRRLLIMGAAALLALLLWAPSGQAKAFEPCDGTIGGEALTTDGQRITVPANGTVAYRFSADAPVRAWSFDMSFGVTSVSISDGTSDSEKTWVEGKADVADYARFGTGLYEVDGRVELADGDVCQGTVLVEVTKNPFTTVAGWVAFTAGAGGLTLAGGASIMGAKAALAAAKP